MMTMDGGAGDSGGKTFTDFLFRLQPREIFYPRVMLSIKSSASLQQWLRWFLINGEAEKSLLNFY